MLRLILATLLIVAVGCSAGCTDAGYARATALGFKHRVTLYSGGSAVRTWTSSGKVFPEDQSDGYYFCDDESGHLIRVTGVVVVESVD
ncbi:MAG: hypothetical protein ACK5Q5_22450 [Planctomycetaceae bacterium]